MRKIWAELAADLERDEGNEQFPYMDTKGKLTIGIGRNLTDRGLSPEEINVLAANDIDIAVDELTRHVPWWTQMSEPRRRALANMFFNMGWPRLSGFKKMLAALEDRNYNLAANEALDSKWAREDVPERARRQVDLMRFG